MPEPVSSLPDRPLTKDEVLSMSDAREYCIDRDVDEAYAISLMGENQVHALGYDAGAGGWVRFYSEKLSNDSTEAIDAFEDEIYQWLDEHFSEELDSGKLSLAGPSDPVPEDAEKEVPPEVEQGLEPEYDCPDCGYYKTGLTTGPHAYLDHLQQVHDYSESEAMEILQG